MTGIPGIRLSVEVDAVRHTLVRHLNEQLADLDRMVEATVTPELVASALRHAIEMAVREELDAFFRHGDGRRVVRETVKGMV